MHKKQIKRTIITDVWEGAAVATTDSNCANISASFMNEIKGEPDYGVRDLVNLFGIESPGLTSSLTIGEYVKKLL